MDHYADVNLLSGKAAVVKLVVLLVVLAVLPFVVPGYRVFTLNYMAIFVIVSIMGGEISAPELQNQPLTVGSFPWRLQGGEAACVLTVAFVGKLPS